MHLFIIFIICKKFLQQKKAIVETETHNINWKFYCISHVKIGYHVYRKKFWGQNSRGQNGPPSPTLPQAELCCPV